MSEFADRARDIARRVIGPRSPTGPLRVTAPLSLLELERDGIVALDSARPAVRPDRMRIAVVVPQFRRGSGGHSTVMHLVSGLETLGHRCSVWIDDSDGTHSAQTPAETETLFREFFGGDEVHASWDAWTGADVAIATGWQTVARVLRLDGCARRAYLVQDHEPEFYGTSAEATWAAASYGHGLPCIAASPWLARLLEREYGASATSFDLGVDHSTYSPGDGGREGERVLFYARAVTARRAVPLGVLALTELARRREDAQIVIFGEGRELAVPFAATQLGVLEGDALAEEYRRATVGVVLSMTNPSLVPTEMLACGLPVVDLASASMRETFGDDGPVVLARFSPLALADAIEELLDAPVQRARRREAGLALAAARTWPSAARQVEAALRKIAGS